MVLVSGEFWMSQSRASAESGRGSPFAVQPPSSARRRSSLRSPLVQPDALGDPARAGRELVVHPVGMWLRAELRASCLEAAVAEADFSRLGEPFLEAAPYEQPHAGA